MFNFTPLLGVHSASPASQSLLEFEGGVKVLVDVGWDVEFDVAQLKNLETYVTHVLLLLCMVFQICRGSTHNADFLCQDRFRTPTIGG